MTDTPKPTVDQIKALRERYVELSADEPTPGFAELRKHYRRLVAICDLALKGIEAEAALKSLHWLVNLHRIKDDSVRRAEYEGEKPHAWKFAYEVCGRAPQKPEPPMKAYDLASVNCICAPLPEPPNDDCPVHRAEPSGEREYTEYDRTGVEPSPSPSVEGLVERLKTVCHDGNLYAAQRDFMLEVAEALSRMEQERDAYKDSFLKAAADLVDEQAERDALSARVQELKELVSVLERGGDG